MKPILLSNLIDENVVKTLGGVRDLSKCGYDFDSLLMDDDRMTIRIVFTCNENWGSNYEGHNIRIVFNNDGEKSVTNFNSYDISASKYENGVWEASWIPYTALRPLATFIKCFCGYIADRMGEKVASFDRKTLLAYLNRQEPINVKDLMKEMNQNV